MFTVFNPKCVCPDIMLLSYLNHKTTICVCVCSNSGTVEIFSIVKKTKTKNKQDIA